MILIEKWKFKISRGNKMATYYEFKKIIGKIFGCGNIEENEDDIDVVIQNRHYPREEANIPDFTISNAELQELYNNVVSTSSENLEFFSENSYEIAIDLDYPSLRRDHYPVIADDTINRIKYTFSFPTMEYCAFLLINIVDIRNRQSNHRGLFPMRLLRPFDTLRRYGNDEEPLSLQSLLPRMIGELSLKIESVERKSLETFRKYKTSFAFQFMYRSGFSLIEFSDIEEMFHLNRTTRERINFEQLDSPPLREYTVDVVDYYKMALSSNDPYIKFISFYHVMEYFYDEVFKKKMITDLRDKITNPGFSYRDDDKIYEMALFVKNRLRMNDESGQGNELAASCSFISSEVKLFTVHTILPPSTFSASRILFVNGVHSITNIFPLLSAIRILQFEAIGNSISIEIALSVLSAFSSKYLTIKHELKPARIFFRLVITKVIATASPCSFSPSSPLMKEEVVMLNLFPFDGE